MDRKFSVLAAALSLLVLLSSTSGALAQAPEPPCPVKPPPGGSPYHTPEGRWIGKERTTPLGNARELAPQDTGGPDEFGYTWGDTSVLEWIDASGGTDTGMSGDSWDQATGPIPLPFPFKYYENTYNEVYIAAGGYLAFTEASTWNDQEPVPSPQQPNSVIAPYWTPTYIGPDSWVRYVPGGAAPGRYFAVEWHDVKGGGPDDTRGRGEIYRFQVLLYENGNILFQYQSMTFNDSWWCGAIGIEDSAGLDGLKYTGYCNQAPSYRGIRFYRPPPWARVNIRPLYQGHFTHPGETAVFQVSVVNAGDLGADTLDLSVSSTWTATLYAADGVTPLTDTDGDGTVDTGLLPEESAATVVVAVDTPGTAVAGDDNVTAITARSSLNTSKSETASLQTAVPAPFAQVYRDDDDGAMSLCLVHPGEESVSMATPDGHQAYDMAVTETPTGFAYVWAKGRSTGSSDVGEIEYALLDNAGRVTRPAGRLTDHTGATVHTSDYSPAVAVAPNGRIGVTWYRYLDNSSSGQWNYNVYYAVLDAAGNVVVPPTNLTNTPYWGSGWVSTTAPQFADPRIAATDDNRFVLAWHRYISTGSGNLSDIYYTIRDTAGEVVKPLAQFTFDTPDYADRHCCPNLARLSGNRVLFTWSSSLPRFPSHVVYAVLDSAGNTVKDKTHGGSFGLRSDAVQLSDGKVIVAWDTGPGFVVLDGATYSPIAWPIWLSNPASLTGGAGVSVASDNAGHAILTWMDDDSAIRHNLYYALVGGDGSILTNPMIFRTSQAAEPRIDTSLGGYGNTSFTDTTPPTSRASSPEFALDPFQVTWNGSDAGFGLASYDVQVRDRAGGTWDTWLSSTTATSATYSAVTVGHTYYFRSVARDWAGNIETALPADGDTHTTIATYQVTGQVVNNRYQPVFDATVVAQPAGLNTATTDGEGDYVLYLGGSGLYSLTASHGDFGDLPPRYGVPVSGDLSGIDFVLPPLDDTLSNGGWETGDLGGWSTGPGVTPTVEMTATHTGHYGLDLEMSGGTLAFWPYVTQPVSIPVTWSQPTLSFLYRVAQGSPGNELLATVSAAGDSLTHTLPLTPGEWTHTWLDLSALSGQTATLSLGFRGQPGTQQMLQQVHIDEVSLGESRRGAYSTYLPLLLRSD